MRAADRAGARARERWKHPGAAPAVAESPMTPQPLPPGTTTIQDMLTLYPFDDRHLDAVMHAYERIGIRVVFSLQYADRKGLETIPYWKDIFPQDLHPLLSTAAEPERQLDLLGHFETTCLKAPPRPRVH